MDMKVNTVIALMIVFFFPAALLCQWQSSDWSSSEDAAVPIAMNYVRMSPTFRFDGVTDSIEVTDTIVFESYPLQFGVKVEFDCLHTGYGDRTGQILGQAITHHVVLIMVSNGDVIQADMDGVWDMKLQAFIEED